MDTTPAPAKKNLRADITRKCDERVAETTERLDPHRARAQRLLQDVDDGETTSFEGTFKSSKEAPKYATPLAYKDAPLLTLRELMPGSTGADEEDGDLDQSFRADKIEFLVMSRNTTEAERDGEMVIEEVGDVDWDIPTRDDFEDVMGLVFELFTEEESDLVHACLLYTSPSPRDRQKSRMPSSA